MRLSPLYYRLWSLGDEGPRRAIRSACFVRGGRMIAHVAGAAPGMPAAARMDSPPGPRLGPCESCTIPRCIAHPQVPRRMRCRVFLGPSARY
eukprot:scaffold182257_cov39-Tisochrysis_lutea.AAC.1